MRDNSGFRADNFGEPPELSLSPPHSFWREMRGWLKDVLIALVIAVLMVVFLYQPVKVEGTSMQPQLDDQERIFVNKFIYRFEEIRRGDVIVFYYPRDPSKSFIKRIVGVPGDSVTIKNGRVLINGTRLEEPYVKTNFLDSDSYPPVLVKEGNYYVLGDHRNASNDSRSWGQVPRENIFGKAVFCYWPIQKAGLIK
jgi:signal peptidase I